MENANLELLITYGIHLSQFAKISCCRYVYLTVTMIHARERELYKTNCMYIYLYFTAMHVENKQRHDASLALASSGNTPIDKQ
jgi:hypothetical protein